MDAVQNRKRSLGRISKPVQNEVENTPPKRRKINHEEDSSGGGSLSPPSSESEDTIAVKSFYGKREKISFPHSPGRRKAVSRVLQKLSDEDSANENKKSVSSGSDSRSSKPKQRFTRQRKNKPNENKFLNDKKTTKCQVVLTPLGKVSNNLLHTPKSHSSVSNDSSQMPKVLNEVTSNSSETPKSTEKRIFKHKSPGSAQKVLHSVVIRKGFDLKFTCVPKKRVISKNKNVKAKASTKPISPHASNISSTSSNGKNSCQSPGESKLKDRNLSNKSSAVEESVSSQETVESNSEINTSINKTAERRNFDFVTKDSPDSLSSEQSLTSNRSGPSTRSSSRYSKQNNLGKRFSLDSTTSNSPQSSVTGSNMQSAVADDSQSISKESSAEGDTQSLVTDDMCNAENSNSSFQDDFTPISQEEERSNTSSREQKSGLSSDTDSVVAATPQKKYFSIFSKNSTPSPSTRASRFKGSLQRKGRGSPCSSPALKFIDKHDDQMTLDAGQKKFGATQCDVCGMVYAHANPTDETTHAKFHQSLLNALKFPGWKKERVVQEYLDDGSRVIEVHHNDPKYATRKVEEINKIMGQELGFPETSLILRNGTKVFLLVSDEKKIMGCCIAESITQGYKVIPDSQSSQEAGARPWCCESEPEKASVGISRIWVNKQNRRMGVATKLLDCVRQWYQFGIFIPKHRVAFSDPTPDGKLLATKYTGTSSFLVYKYG